MVALELLLARVLRQEEEHGVAQDVEDREGEERDAEHHDHELDELTGDVASHASVGRGAPAPPAPLPGRGAGCEPRTSPLIPAGVRGGRPLRGAYFLRGVTANIRSTSSRGAS